MGNIAANISKQVLTVASSNFLSDPPITCFGGGLVLSILVVAFCLWLGYARFIGLGDPIRWRHRYIYKGVSDG